ncbi:hypothetical protein V8E36_000894 [Tilletia maclaganii]
MTSASPLASPALRATNPPPSSHLQPGAAGSSSSTQNQPQANSHDDGYDNDPDADYDDDDDLGEDDAGAGAGDTHMLSEHIVRSGYLNKRGEKRKNWKKRWFVLRSTKLAYYKNEKEYQLLRFIDMSEVLTVAAVELKGKDYTFGIVTPSRTYYVNAGSRKEMQDWIDDLNAVKERTSQTYSTDSAATEQQQQQPLASPQPLAALSPNLDGPGSGRAHPGSLAFTQEDLSSLSSAPLTTPGISTASSAQLGAGAGGGGGGILSSSDEGEQDDDDWDEDEIADQAMPLPGPAFGLGSSLPTSQLSSSPSGYSASNSDSQHAQQQQQSQVTPQALPLQQGGPKPGASLLINPNKVIMQGYLMKQSKARKHWRKRWFVLSGSRLLYAKDHMNTKAHRVINISSILDAIEYEPREKEGKERSERDNTSSGYPASADVTAPQLSTSPSQQSGYGSFAAAGVAAGAADSGSELERSDKGERESIKASQRRRRSKSHELSDGAGSAAAAAAGASAAVGGGPVTPGAAATTNIGLNAAPSNSVLGASTGSSAGHGGNSTDGGAAEQNATSSPVLIPNSSPRPPHAQLAALSLGPSAVSSTTGPTEGAAGEGGKPPRTKRKENCFKIITPKRVYLVCAPTEEEEIKWLSALRALLLARR